MTLKDLTNALLHRATLWLLRARLWLQVRARLTTSYQPDPFAPEEGSARLPRESHDRWRAIAAALPARQLSTLDVGCNEGYFVFRLAERGGLCVGVDIDRNAIMVARARSALHRIPNAVFANMAVDATNVETLPDADVVVCLSVFHHWVRHWGLERADGVLEALAAHARTALVFETGQPDEAGARWADILSFMGTEPEAWVRDRLHRLGFADVRVVGRFGTTVSSAPRSTFVALRTG